MKLNFIYIKNDVFRDVPIEQRIDVNVGAATSNSKDFLDLLRASKKEITEKTFGHISSFNFNRDVFYSGKWNELSKIARGLFLDNETGEIVSRGFDKFFNYQEDRFNTDAWLKMNLKFPVTAYKKYNGFLGILSFDKKEGKFLFCSKSCVDSPYSNYFKDIFYSSMNRMGVDSEYYRKLASHLVEENTCLVFEVIDPINDPHIVEYAEPKIVLLAEIKLEQKFSQTPYDELKKFAEDFKFSVKELIKKFDNWEQLKEFIIKSENYQDTIGVEGWVLEDNEEYHFKLKGAWYKFWKNMRYFKQKLQNGHQVSTSGLTTPMLNEVFAWMKQKPREWLAERSIVEVRNEYEKEKNI